MSCGRKGPSRPRKLGSRQHDTVRRARAHDTRLCTSDQPDNASGGRHFPTAADARNRRGAVFAVFLAREPSSVDTAAPATKLGRKDAADVASQAGHLHHSPASRTPLGRPVGLRHRIVGPLPRRPTQTPSTVGDRPDRTSTYPRVPRDLPLRHAALTEQPLDLSCLLCRDHAITPRLQNDQSLDGRIGWTGVFARFSRRRRLPPALCGPQLYGRHALECAVWLLPIRRARRLLPPTPLHCWANAALWQVALAPCGNFQSSSPCSQSKSPCSGNGS